MSDKFIVFSAFDGIGCGRIALDNLGVKDEQLIYYRSEISASANAVYDHHFNGINLGRIEEVTAECFDEPVSLILAGSPCSQISSISPNTHQQLEGKDSKLFFEFVRIWQELKVKFPNNPPAFLFENVVMKKETAQIITSILGVEPVTIESGYHAPCRRKRMYWTSYSLKDYHKCKMEPRKTLSDIIENGYVDSGRGNLKDTGYCVLTTSVASTPTGFRRAINKKISTIVYANPDYIGLTDKEKIDLFEERTKDGMVPLVPEDGSPIFKTGEWRTLSTTERQRGIGLPEGYLDIGISKSQKEILTGKAFCVPTIQRLVFANSDIQRLINAEVKAS